MKPDIEITPMGYDDLFDTMNLRWVGERVSVFNEFLLDILDELEEKELTFACGVRAMHFLQTLPNYHQSFNSHFLNLSTCTIWLELDFALHTKTIKCDEILVMHE